MYPPVCIKEIDGFKVGRGVVLCDGELARNTYLKHFGDSVYDALGREADDGRLFIRKPRDGATDTAYVVMSLPADPAQAFLLGYDSGRPLLSCEIIPWKCPQKDRTVILKVWSQK